MSAHSDAITEELKALGGVNRLDNPFTEVQLAEVLKAILLPK